MASIRERNGSYQIIVSLGRDSEGRKLSQTTTYIPKATTPKAIEKEIDNFARRFEERIKNGQYFDGEKISFEEYAKTWREDWAKHNLTKRVQEDYDSILKNRVFPHIGRLKIAKIRPSNIQSIISGMINKGYAIKTIKYTFTVVNSVMSYAYNMEVIHENPCSRCELPKKQEEIDEDKLHYFDLDQAKTFLNALTREYKSKYKEHTRTLKKTGTAYSVPEYEEIHTIPLQFQAYFQIAIYGGFRRGEMCAITWEDVDFEKRTVSINKAFSRTKEGQFLKPPKTKSGIRTVALPLICFETLKAWKVEEMELALKLGTKWEGYRGKDFSKNFVFIQTESGRAMDLDTPSHKFGEILAMYNATCEREEDKLPTIRLHDLRHTSATLLISEGVDIETISRRLGHSKPSVTLDIYGHALPAKDDEASRKLETLFA